MGDDANNQGNKKIAFLFPGQGSQRVGMDAGLARDRFSEADEVLGFRLSKIITEGPEEALQLTANTQPAILTVSVAMAEALTARGVRAHVLAGHSLGEYSALVYAGALTFADALRLVHLRGRFMQEAVPEGRGAMAAVIGLDARAVADTCSECSPDESDACQPANYNGAGQVVIAGHKGAVERAMAMCKQKGAKLVKALPVSAPFHSALMAPAAERLRSELERVKVGPLSVPVIPNITAEPTADAGRVKELLYRQVTGSVRWEESVLRLAKDGVTEAYEVGPGKVLSGLTKRIAPAIALKADGEGKGA
jgi:[acyl-carrier-protein] S-malonyltransferase